MMKDALSFKAGEGVCPCGEVLRPDGVNRWVKVGCLNR